MSVTTRLGETVNFVASAKIRKLCLCFVTEFMLAVAWTQSCFSKHYVGLSIFLKYFLIIVYCYLLKKNQICNF